MIFKTNKYKSHLVKLKESKFSKDTIWLIGSQAILLVSGFLMNILIGQKLGAKDLGVFNQILGYYMILSSIFSLGLNNSIIKKIAANDNLELDKKILSSNIFLTIIFSTLFTLTFIILSLTFPKIFSSIELSKTIIIPFISMPFYNLNKNFMAYYSGKRKQKEFSIFRSLRWIIIITYSLICLILNKGLTEILFAFLISEITLTIISFFHLRKLFTKKFNRFDLVENFTFGFKSFSAELFAVLNDKFDILLIGYFLTNSEVGIYSFFIFFAKSLYIFPGILQQNINPIISRFWEEKNKLIELQEKLNKLKRINFIALITQTCLLVLFYQLVISFVKEEFNNSMYLLLISIFGIFPSALISWSGSMLIMTGKLKENITRTFLIMIISITSTFILSYSYGLIGATIAVCINSIISFIIMNTFVSKLLGLKLI